MLSTNYLATEVSIAGAMFARGSQENYNLDALVDYCTENIPDATPGVNPAYRRVDGEVRKAVGKLGRQRAKFAALLLEPMAYI